MTINSEPAMHACHAFPKARDAIPTALLNFRTRTLSRFFFGGLVLTSGVSAT